MRRTAVCAAVIGLALATTRGEVSPRPASGPIRLAFAPAPGTGLDYAVSSLVDVSGRGFLGRDLALNADIRGGIGLRVTAATSDGVRADLVGPGIDVTVRLPGRVLSRTLGPEAGAALQVVFDRTGRLSGVLNPEVLGAGGVFNISLPQVLRDYFPALPPRPVAPGDAWRESRRLEVPFQGVDLEVALDVDYILEDIVSGPEGRQALVSAAYTAVLSGRRDLAAAAGVVEGRGAGQGTLRFLIDRGWLAEYRLDFTAAAVFALDGEAGRQFAWPFTLSVFAEIVLRNAGRDQVFGRPDTK